MKRILFASARENNTTTDQSTFMVMKRSLALTLLASLLLAPVTRAQVPQVMHYQGRILVGNNNFNGNGHFKFALVDPVGTTLWNNDGTGIGLVNNAPAADVTVNCDKGLYSVMLGESPAMVAIPINVFGHADVRLRVWFSDNQNGFQQFVPDQKIASVGYAMMAAAVQDGAITAAKLADGSITSIKLADATVTTTKIANDAVTSAQLANDIDLGSATQNGRLDVFRTTAGTPAITLDGAGNMISVFGDDGSELGRLGGVTYGEVLLRDSVGHEIAARVTANGNGGGRMYLYNSNGLTRALVSGENAGGVVTLYQADGSGSGAILDGNNGDGAGQLTLYQGDGQTGAALYGDDGQGSGALSLRKANGDPGARLYGGPNNGSLLLYNNAGNLHTGIYSWENEEGVVSVRNRFGNETIYLWGRNSQDTAGGQIGLKKNDGSQTITLNADHNGEGRITTQVLQITGGSDLSEQFDVNATHDVLKPGMIVSIDPANAGQLTLSTNAYDRTVAGVLSGAGGVKPGMLMGQAGTVANGKHPVALTGRVYCQVDASHGAIRPGDLLTTSDTPGHAMKVADHGRAQGAIIGKAMSGLESGKGLVLVLISLQ
jgi:hypothetical protein